MDFFSKWTLLSNLISYLDTNILVSNRLTLVFYDKDSGHVASAILAHNFSTLNTTWLIQSIHLFETNAFNDILLNQNPLIISIFNTSQDMLKPFLQNFYNRSNFVRRLKHFILINEEVSEKEYGTIFKFLYVFLAIVSWTEKKIKTGSLTSFFKTGIYSEQSKIFDQSTVDFSRLSYEKISCFLYYDPPKSFRTIGMYQAQQIDGIAGSEIYLVGLIAEKFNGSLDFNVKNYTAYYCTSDCEVITTHFDHGHYEWNIKPTPYHITDQTDPSLAKVLVT